MLPAALTPSVMLSLAASLVRVRFVASACTVTAALAAAGTAKMATPAARTAAEVRILGFMPAKTQALRALFRQHPPPSPAQPLQVRGDVGPGGDRGAHRGDLAPVAEQDRADDP